MQLKVVKFGGSSLADADQFKKAAEIVKAEKERRYVVPSAPGKRNPVDTKVTDMLYSCYDAASRGDNIDELFDTIAARYNGIIEDLGLDLSLESEFNKVKKAFENHAGRDYAASRGEYLNGIIFAAYLGFEFIDAAELIFFNDAGVLDTEKTYKTIEKTLKQHENAVIPGFYGIMPNDTIKTFSRGGSDISGAIIARGVYADVYENWTDVSGFLMADPRVVENPKTIGFITYRELRELSYMGATVLHEDSIFPVRNAGIPINIRNTNVPDDRGTWIVPSVDSEKDTSIVTGIAGKKGFSVISIEKDMMNSELGFGRRALYVLEQNGISFEHLPSGIDTMSIIVFTSAIKDKLNYVVSGLMSAVSPDGVECEHGLALIAIVGRGMVRTKGTAAKVFAALAEADINVRMIDQGSGELNIIVGVNESDFEEAIRSIYGVFR